MTEKLHISLAQSSDRGNKDQNEDFYGACLPDDSLLQSKGIACAIADGMGSCANAQEASEHCVKGFLGDYFSTSETWSVKSSGARVLTALNNWLLSKGDRDHAQGMVTTFSALVLKSTTAHIFHIGDSRIYRYRDGDLEQLTTDHRVWISDRKNYLSRAMGIDLHLDIDYKTLSARVGDLYIMTTDGVHDYLDEAQIKNHINETDSLQQISDSIIRHAIAAKSHDNVTCQIIRVDALPGQDANEVYNELTRLPFPPPMGPGMSIDGYEILDEIHASTTSQLYKVRDRKSARLFIMKTPSVNFDDDPAYIERFYMEEWAGKRINSKFVLKVFELPRPRNFLYFIMEYIEGITLRQWITDHPDPDIHEVADIVERIISGLRVFHRMEMLHRDLKPENIMLTKDGHIKIIDFGSVKIAGVQEISTPVERIDLLGTKNYTAPEFLSGSEGSNRSDIFSLGVITYEMLTGKLPYGDKLTRNINLRTLNKIKYTSAITYNPMIPLWLDGALEKAVNTDQRLRYDTLSEFLFDLTHPNPAFMNRSAPMLERNPVLMWKLVAGISIIVNLILIYAIFSTT
jgi:serine/threonine protein phosphatase PrpC